MKEAGCLRLSIGVESGDPFILRQIQKQLDLEEAVDAVDIINQAGLVSFAGFMIGHPDETIDSLQKTILFADRLDPTFTGFRKAIPYPGCVFGDIAEKRGGIQTEDFSDYRDDRVVYIPPGLADFDLEEIRKLAYTYFFMKNRRRFERLIRQGFSDPYRDTLEDYLRPFYEGGKEVTLSLPEMFEQYCKRPNQPGDHE